MTRVVERRSQAFHRFVLARSILVGAKRRGEVLCILTGKARRRGTPADTLVAVASGAAGSSSLARRLVACGRSLRPGGLLQRVVKRDVAQIGTAHGRDHRLHHVVLALTALVGVYCRNEVFRVQPDQARHARGLADAALTMAPRAARRRGLSGLDRVGLGGSRLSRRSLHWLVPDRGSRNRQPL